MHLHLGAAVLLSTFFCRCALAPWDGQRGFWSGWCGAIRRQIRRSGSEGFPTNLIDPWRQAGLAATIARGACVVGLTGFVHGGRHDSWELHWPAACMHQPFQTCRYRPHVSVCGSPDVLWPCVALLGMNPGRHVCDAAPHFCCGPDRTPGVRLFRGQPMALDHKSTADWACSEALCQCLV